MTTSDWITLLGAVVAALAIVVSARIALIAVKIQRNQAEVERQQAKKEADKDLADVAQTLANRVAQIFTVPIGGPEMATASSEITGLVIRANELAEDDRNATWYLYYSLATAYMWLWEVDKANDNWEKALTKADSPHSQVMILLGEATFHYNVGSQTHIDAGRVCFGNAEQILKNNFPDDLGREQLTWILGQQAGLEYGTGDRDESARIYAQAWEQQKAITSAWRQLRVKGAVATSFWQTFGQEQAGAPNTIPADLVEYAVVLQQQAQQAAITQQNMMQQSMMQRPPMFRHDSSAVSQQSTPLTLISGRSAAQCVYLTAILTTPGDATPEQAEISHYPRSRRWSWFLLNSGASIVTWPSACR